MEREDPLYRPVRIFGAIAAAILLVTALAVIAINQNTSESPSSSYAAGLRDAQSLSVPRGASDVDVKAACEAYFTNDLSSNEITAQRGPFVKGCVQGVRDRGTGS